MPFYLSIIGVFLTFLMLIFHLLPATIDIPTLRNNLGFSFYLDGLNSFFLFIYFIIAFLFLFFKEELAFSTYFLTLYVVSLLFFLVGNLYSFVLMLAVILVIYAKTMQRRNSAYWLSLVSLLGLISVFPITVGDQFYLSHYTFVALRENLHVTSSLIFLLIPVWFLLGFFSFNTKHIRNRVDTYFSFNFMTLIGIYSLFRFSFDLCYHSIPFFFVILLEISGLVIALYAGWCSLTVKISFHRLYCLFILSNAMLLQITALLLLHYCLLRSIEIDFAYNILFFGLFIQTIGFALVFFCSYLLTDQLTSQSAIIPLFLLGLLLSGFPPLAGFSVFWGAMQLGIDIAFSHYLFGMLFVLFIVGCNAVIFLFSLLGWVNALLLVGKSFVQQQSISFKEFFSFESNRIIKISIIALFIVSMIPGIILFLSSSIPLLNHKVSNYSFFTFGYDKFNIGYLPISSFLFFILLLFFCYFRNKQKNGPRMNEGANSFSSLDQKPFFKYLEKTTFDFGKGSFQFLLADIFFIKNYTYMIQRFFRCWLSFCKTLICYRTWGSKIIEEHEQIALLIVFLVGLLSVGLFI